MSSSVRRMMLRNYSARKPCQKCQSHQTRGNLPSGQDFLVKSSEHKKQKATPNPAPLLKMTVFILLLLLLSLFSFVFYLSFFFFFFLLLVSNVCLSICMILLSSRNTETDSRNKFEIVLTQSRVRSLKIIADKSMQKFQTVLST